MKHPERLTVEEIESQRPWISGIGAGCLPVLCGAAWPVILLFAGYVCALLGLARRADRW